MEYFTMGKSIFVCSLLFLTLFINFNSVAFADEDGWRLVDHLGTAVLRKDSLGDEFQRTCMLKQSKITDQVKEGTVFIFTGIVSAKAVFGTVSAKFVLNKDKLPKTIPRMIWEKECGSIPWALLEKYFGPE
jgi:hypothetical protein